jgi:hypothetical protein
MAFPQHLAGGPGTAGQHRGVDERTPVLADDERGDGAFPGRALVKAFLVRRKDAREDLEHLIETVDAQVDSVPPGLGRTQFPPREFVAGLPGQQLARTHGEYRLLAAGLLDRRRAEHLDGPPELDDLGPFRVRFPRQPRLRSSTTPLPNSPRS